MRYKLYINILKDSCVMIDTKSSIRTTFSKLTQIDYILNSAYIDLDYAIFDYLTADGYVLYEFDEEVTLYKIKQKCPEAFI